ncbi:MAG: DUF167 family protein [Pseudomonadota bacterium]
MTAIRRDGTDLLVAVYAQPRASRDEIAGFHGDALKIRVAAPPVDGAANEALCRFLARMCGVAKSAVSVESGETGRHKTVRIRSPRQLPDEFGIPPH